MKKTMALLSFLLDLVSVWVHGVLFALCLLFGIFLGNPSLGIVGAMGVFIVLFAGWLTRRLKPVAEGRSSTDT
ncbi:hypothetical protein DLREEDagrD3_10440 [Denitratisoma sp. agr-D3]